MGQNDVFLFCMIFCQVLFSSPLSENESGTNNEDEKDSGLDCRGPTDDVTQTV